MRTAIRAAVACILVVATIAVWAIHGLPGYFPWAHGTVTDHRAAFDSRVRGADGLRVRSSSSDAPWLFEHRERFEDVWFTTDDPMLTREFLELVRFDESCCGDGCLCIGGTRIDVLRGGFVSISFTLKHGAAIRSAELWFGDAGLTPDSADAVCSWLREHGVPHAMSPRQRQALDAATRRARTDAQDTLLGRDRAERLRSVTQEASVGPLLAKWEPDAAARVELAVRFAAIARADLLEGDDEPGARAQVLVDRWLADASEFPSAAATLAQLLADDATAARAARVLARRGRDWISLVDEQSPGIRLRAARALLASDERGDRRAAIELLRGFTRDPETRALLLSLLVVPEKGRSPVHVLDAAAIAVQFCDPALFDRLQEIADRCGPWSDADRRMRELIEARRTGAAESRQAASPLGGR